ncbi:MAG: hypothetical protein LQ341_005610 [Variospora aurantia]|nr:MAG: hypothetical protein LQ341_005610 [Variospora aurantia]
MLDHYPLENHRNQEKVRSDLIERGKKYRNLCVPENGVQLFDYGGITIEDQKGITRQEFSDRDRKQAFMNFYNQLTTQNCDELIPPKAYIKEFDENFNDRQIRNVFSSALALAREEKRKVLVSDFKKVVKVTKEFQHYLRDQSLLAREKNE